MRALILSIPALLAMSAGVAAQSHIWEGDLRVDTVNEACAGVITVGQFSHIVMQPAGLGTNGADSEFVVIGNRATAHWRIEGAPVLGTNDTSRWRIQNEPTVERRGAKGKLRQVKSVGTIAEGTLFLTLTGTVDNYGVTGCQITFTAPMVKRVTE